VERHVGIHGVVLPWVVLFDLARSAIFSCPSRTTRLDQRRAAAGRHGTHRLLLAIALALPNTLEILAAYEPASA